MRAPTLSLFYGRGFPLKSTDNDFVHELPRKIAGVVLEDTTNNDEGDEGIGSVVLELRLYYNVQTLAGTTLTDSSDTLKSPRFLLASMLLLSRHHPVSYTHLRAHETREDLVCRLLLEKKKN